MDNKERFKRLKKMLNNKQPNYGKATAELDASKNPMKFLQDNKNMSLKGKKGVAF